MQNRAKPPRPLRLQVVPSSAQAKPSAVVVFAVKGLDQHDRPITIDQAERSASGGRTDPNGRFTAPDVDGRYTVTVSALSEERQLHGELPNRLFSFPRHHAEPRCCVQLAGSYPARVVKLGRRC